MNLSSDLPKPVAYMGRTEDDLWFVEPEEVEKTGADYEPLFTAAQVAVLMERAQQTPNERPNVLELFRDVYCR